MRNIEPLGHPQPTLFSPLLNNFGARRATWALVGRSQFIRWRLPEIFLNVNVSVHRRRSSGCSRYISLASGRLRFGRELLRSLPLIFISTRSKRLAVLRIALSGCSASRETAITISS